MKRFWSLLAALTLIIQTAWAAPMVSALESKDITEAYQRFLKKPATELSKISFLLDRFKHSNAQVIYEGHEYDALKAIQYAKTYVREKYDGKQSAESWIKVHAYRSKQNHQIIHYKDPAGKIAPLRDVLLEELTRLNQWLKQRKAG